MSFIGTAQLLICAGGIEFARTYALTIAIFPFAFALFGVRYGYDHLQREYARFRADSYAAVVLFHYSAHAVHAEAV